jgi:two-component system, chemotaxis family, protein-glutamate methylesterase/glutaminase
VLRVLVVDDSAVARQLLTHILNSDPSIEVIAESVNGAEAVEMAATHAPDVITMDIQMPVLDGLEATRRIMEQQPRPIVLVSSSFDRFDVNRSFQALEAGALAIVQKPEGPASTAFPKMATELITTVKLMAGVKVVTRRRRPIHDREQNKLDRLERGPVDAAGIGASTGGPAALAAVLGNLPADLPIPILVVQHITTGFEDGLVDWLDGLSPLRVGLATAGQRLQPGIVLIAPQQKHMGMSARGRVILSDSDPIEGHRPSATYLFDSMARALGPKSLGVVLSGMGRDGASGLVAIKQAGGQVIAQDEASSVVYGMPREAVSLGVVDQVLPITQIAPAILHAATVSGES